MNRISIINHLIDKNNYKTYLEIGVAKGASFSKVKSNHKIGVDPKSTVATHKITSDKFFAGNKKTFDIIFIDGLHITAQVDRDIKNSLRVLNKGGTIVLHDCNPPRRTNQMVPKPGNVAWTGDVWKSIAKIRCTDSNLQVCVVDCDWGCGIIQRGKQRLYKNDPLSKCLTWDYLNRNRKELLNLISRKQFTSKF